MYPFLDIDVVEKNGITYEADNLKKGIDQAVYLPLINTFLATYNI